MKGRLILAYGVFAYASFVAAILYLVGFVGNLLVPKSIDSPVTQGASPVTDAAVNLALIGLFALQHSVMARPVFKQWIRRYIPAPVERPTFVLCTSIVFGILFYFWQPMTGTIWRADSEVVRLALLAMFFIGWLIALVSTFAINHFDLFGLRQVILAWRGTKYTGLSFSKSGLYRFVRHPINLGFLIAVWSAPHMTVGRLLFAGAMTLYIFGATILEERDLVAAHGDEYRRYRREVPMILPLGRYRNTS